MVTVFKGFNTINQERKFGLTGFDLIKRDLINAFHIRQGEVPGRPDVGTNIWTYIFEPLTDETRSAITAEIRRVISQDPRLSIHDLQLFSGHHSVIVEVEVLVGTEVSPRTLALIFDERTHTVRVR